MRVIKIIMGFSLLWFILMLFNCSKNDTSKTSKSAVSFADSSVVAIVNGDPIYYSDVDNAVKQFLNQLGKDPQQFQQQQSDTALWRQALDWIVSIRLLAQEARKQNIKVEKREVDAAYNSIKRRFPTEQQFLAALKDADLTVDQFATNLRREIMVQKLLDKEVGSRIEDVSEQEARDYYDKHGDEFMLNEQIRVHHILFKVSETAESTRVKHVEEKARRILARIRNGEDFEELARQYSEDPSALKGGDLGFFSKGDMIKNFEDAAFALKTGEVSDLVRTPLGFHIIRLDQRKSSQKAPYEEVKINIKLKLKQQRSNQLLNQYVETLKAAADIKIRDKV